MLGTGTGILVFDNDMNFLSACLIERCYQGSEGDFEERPENEAGVGEQ